MVWHRTKAAPPPTTSSNGQMTWHGHRTGDGAPPKPSHAQTPTSRRKGWCTAAPMVVTCYCQLAPISQTLVLGRKWALPITVHPRAVHRQASGGDHTRVDFSSHAQPSIRHHRAVAPAPPGHKQARPRTLGRWTAINGGTFTPAVPTPWQTPPSSPFRFLVLIHEGSISDANSRDLLSKHVRAELVFSKGFL